MEKLSFKHLIIRLKWLSVRNKSRSNILAESKHDIERGWKDWVDLQWSLFSNLFVWLHQFWAKWGECKIETGDENCWLASYFWGEQSGELLHVFRWRRVWQHVGRQNQIRIWSNHCFKCYSLSGFGNQSMYWRIPNFKWGRHLKHYLRRPRFFNCIMQGILKHSNNYNSSQ